MDPLIRKRLIEIGIILASGLLFFSIIGGSMYKGNERKVLSELMGIALPSSVEDIHYYKQQRSPDLYEHYLYAKFKIPKETFAELLQDMELQIYEKSAPQLRRLLPAAWKTETTLRLDWWDPGLEFNEDVAMQYNGSEGWTVAKYKDGYAYIVLYRRLRK